MPAGRPETKIDWKIVDDLLISGCTGMEVSSYLGIHHDTLYYRVQDEFKMNFTEYASKYRQKGEALLRHTQFKKAIKQSDNTMLIWLGKNRLGQRESPVDVILDPQTVSQYTALMQQITAAQSANSALKIDESKINTEHKS